MIGKNGCTRLPLDIASLLRSDGTMSASTPHAHAPVPDETTARAIAAAALGWPDARARRFTTGMAWYVYEVQLEGQMAVVRIGLPAQANSASAIANLWNRLAPLGVPLPQILARGLHDGLPYIVMTRLPGTDLGHVMRRLTPQQLTAIAHSVADAQLATARLGRASRFGFSATPEAAPHASWTAAIAASIERSVKRIAANGLFPESVAGPVLKRLEEHRPTLDKIAATPFLHDTTTKNVLVTEAGAFAGIVDVDDLCFGDPRYAPALTKAALLAFGAGPPSYIDPWMARMGLPTDGVFTFYVAELLLNFMSEHGMSFNGNQTQSDPATREHLHKLLIATLDEAP